MDVLNEFPLVDEHGKRYREFGRGCREYAPTIPVPRETAIKHKPLTGPSSFQVFHLS